MSIEQADVVDGFGIDLARNMVVLTISDHLLWDARHLEVLEAKLASYIRFIESGQLKEALPSAEGKTVEIQVFCEHRPNKEGEILLAAANEAVSTRGVRFTYGPLPDCGYSEDHG